MEFTPEAVEIMTDDLAARVKYRLCVGYVIGERLYAMRKFVLAYPEMVDVEPPLDRLMQMCRRTYDQIEVPGEIIMPIFGYDLGAYCEYDDDGLPIGEWPPIGAAKITYTEKFLMKGGRLPPGYEHLMPMRWLKP